jgi:hypothetical protein
MIPGHQAIIEQEMAVSGRRHPVLVGGASQTKDGKRLKLVFQTSLNAPRQKTQAIVKQACHRAGIDIELKSVTPSVYFSSDAAILIRRENSTQISRSSRRASVLLPILKGLCDNSFHQKSPQRKTNGSVAMRPAGGARPTITYFMPPKVNLIRLSERRCSLL